MLPHPTSHYLTFFKYLYLITFLTLLTLLPLLTLLELLALLKFLTLLKLLTLLNYQLYDIRTLVYLDLTILHITQYNSKNLYLP